MWRVLVVIFFLLILAGINYLVVESFWWWGYFQTTYNHNNGKICHKLPGTGTGSMDIHDLGGGRAFISSGTGQGNGTGGKIFLVNIASSPPTAEQLFIKNNDFKFTQSSGVSSWTDPKTNDIYLYVISRDPEQSVVKLLYDDSVTTEKLKYIDHIANESDFVSLNDLVVVDKDQFYFTNDVKYCYVMEATFRLPFGSIGLYKDGSAKLLVENLFFPNGLALSADKKLLYVGMTGSREIRVYTILDDGKLSFNNSVKVSTSVFDLFVDPSGDILFAATPVLYKVAHYVYEDPTETSVPSQIMRVKMLSPGEADVEEVYSNDGSEISASTSVVIYDKKMLVGTAMTDAWYCI